MQRRGLRFSAGTQFHLINARQRERTFRTGTGIKCPGNLRWIVITQVPREAIHSLVSRNRLGALDAIGPFRRLFALLLFFAGEMTIDILDAGGKVVRHLSSKEKKE